MELSIGEIRELACAGSQASGGGNQSHPYKIGRNYYFRTVTMHITGKLVAVHPQELVVEDAAWVADSGRWAQALADGTLNEVEPFPTGEIIIGRGSIIDAADWKHALPRSQK